MPQESNRGEAQGTALERLNKVRAAVAAGKSNRAIARELGIDEGTVRRDRRKLALPKDMLDRVFAGDKAEPMLAEHRRTQVQQECQRSAREEHPGDDDATACAKTINGWLDRRPLFRPDKEMVLEEAQRWPLASKDPPHPTRVGSVDEVIEACRPGPEPEGRDMSDEINYLVRWIAIWLPYLFPDAQVREEGIRRAKQQVLRSPLYPSVSGVTYTPRPNAEGRSRPAAG